MGLRKPNHRAEAPVKKEKSFTRYFKNCSAEIKNLIFYTAALAR
jgi:hypothetical protein